MFAFLQVTYSYRNVCKRRHVEDCVSSLPLAQGHATLTRSSPWKLEDDDSSASFREGNGKVGLPVSPPPGFPGTEVDGGGEEMAAQLT